MQQIQALRFEVEEVGKHVKGSKKRYCWEIALKDKSHVIVLDFSFISGKVKITVDRKILLENQLPANVSFQYPFTLDGFALNIIQQGESFELRINNKVFSHLYTQQKTNTEFKKYEEEVKDIKVNITQLNPNSKKMNLNIGAFGGAGTKKKKGEASESEGWNAFAGNSFPNYFSETTAQDKPKVKPKQNSLLDQQQTKASEISLIQDFPAPKVEQKKSQNLFQFGEQSPKVVLNSSDASQMKDMFDSLTLNPPPPKNNNEVDFFADEPPKIVTEEKSPELVNLFPMNGNNSNLDFNFNSPINAASFGTGFGLQGNSQINMKQFTTSVNSNKATDLNFLMNQPAKQQVTKGVFTKKGPSQQSMSYSQMQSIMSNPNINSSPSNPTNININDFNTMQLMFQTNNNNFGQLNSGFGVAQPQVYSQPSQLNSFNLPQTLPTQSNISLTTPQPISFSQQPNPTDFNTMQKLFQTTNYSNLKQTQPKVEPPKPQTNPLDMFSNNNVTTFSTMSGGSLNNNVAFDMSTFGTMQANTSKTSNFDLNFLGDKPKPVSAKSGDLI